MSIVITNEPVARYKSTVEITPESTGVVRRLHIAFGARNFHEAKKTAINIAVNFFVNNPKYPLEERNSVLELDTVTGSTERMSHLKKGVVFW